MPYDISKLPREMRITSDPGETNVDLIRQRLRKQKFDHLNYDPFVETMEGQLLYNGVLANEESLENNQEKNIYAYLINNGL